MRLQRVLVIDFFSAQRAPHPHSFFVDLSEVRFECIFVLKLLRAGRTPYRLHFRLVYLPLVLHQSFVALEGVTAHITLYSFPAFGHWQICRRDWGTEQVWPRLAEPTQLGLSLGAVFLLEDWLQGGVHRHEGDAGVGEVQPALLTLVQPTQQTKLRGWSGRCRGKHWRRRMDFLLEKKSASVGGAASEVRWTVARQGCELETAVCRLRSYLTSE